MSFAATRYGSSVPRDYNLIQGHPSSYHHFGELDAGQAVHTDGNADNADDDRHEASSSASIHTDDGTEQNLSNISIPSQHIAPAFGRINRLSTTPHVPIVSPRNRRASVNAYPQIAGIPSQYLLGGSAIPPPSAIEDESDLATPMPHHSNKHHRDYLDYPARHNEGTSLLSRRIRQEDSSAAATHDGAVPASYGATSAMAPQHSSGGRRMSTGAASVMNDGPGISGWAAANMVREAPPPGVEQVEAISRESHDNIAWREARVLVGYTLPIFATHVLELSLSVASVFSLGHLGTVELAAASLASMTANVSGFSVISGFISALDTLLPSAYTQQPKSVGLWTQRMGIILAVLLPFVITVWMNAEAVLIRLGQDPEVAHLAGQFLSILAIGLPGYALFETCRRYLQAQGLMHAPTLVLLFVSPLNAFANYMLVWGPERIRLGFIGAPLASALSMWLMAILCFLQCVLAPRDAWDGFSMAAFKWEGIRPVLSLGFAGMVSLAAEWWAWEIVGLVTSLLGTTALAAQSVLLVSSSVTYQLPFGASVATAVRVGNLLGANRASEAKISSRVALILSLAMGGLNSALFLIFRKQWGWLFSSDAEVVSLVEHVLPLLAFFQVADGICGVCGGILRGTGRQAQGAAINMFSYYLIGIPIGLALAFTGLHLGLAGLWIGLTIALLFGSLGMFWFISRTNWEWEVEKVQLRMSLDDPKHANNPATKRDVENAANLGHSQTLSVVDAMQSRDYSRSPHALRPASIAESAEEEEDDTY